MKFERKTLLKLALLAGLIAGLFVTVSELKLDDSSRKQDLASKNKVIFSNNYSIDLSEKEKQWLKENPVIKLGIDRAFPPFGSIDENGEYVGFAADYMKIIERRLNITFDIAKDLPWGETMAQAKAGQLDMIAGLVNTKARQEFLNFSQPYVHNPTIIIHDGLERGYVGSLSNLKGQTVAIEKGSYAAGEIARQFPKINLLLTKNTSAALSMVSSGIADAYVGNAVTASFLIKKLGLQNLAYAGDTPYSSNHSIGVLKTHPILVDIVDKTLASISEDDRNTIKNFWFGLSIRPQWEIRTILYFFAGFIALLLLASYWIISLHKARKQLKESQQAVKLQAELDPLTGLGNRRKFYKNLEKHIRHAKQNQSRFALLFLDLDLFKEVNDALGHFIGDMLLKNVSSRLQKCVNSENIFRLGGDEFMLLLSHDDHDEILTAVVEQIQHELKRPFRVKGNHITITCSLGITTYPDDADNAESLVINGDQAMYHAKKEGRNRYSFFSKELKQQAAYRNRMIRDLKIAKKSDQFGLLYQPIVDLKTKNITKGEALIRWYHPSLGLIPPNEFIPFAEETGLINEIGEWVFEKAVAQTRKITQQFNQDFQMSINASPIQFRKNGMDVNQWYKHLLENDLTGKNIVIEITESLLVDSSSTVKNNLYTMRDRDIQVAIDDFGTGYSSLSYFKRFDIDFLKIDQSFVRNLKTDSDDLVLVHTIINMAHQLGCKVIAEGVETKEQMLLLKKAGCDYGQGYYFSKPLPPNEFREKIMAWNKQENVTLLRTI